VSELPSSPQHHQFYELAQLLQGLPTAALPLQLTHTVPHERAEWMETIAAALEKQGHPYTATHDGAVRIISAAICGSITLRWVMVAELDAHNPADDHLTTGRTSASHAPSIPLPEPDSGWRHNCPPAPAFDGAALFWDNAGNWTITSRVTNEHEGAAKDTLHSCQSFGEHSGASVLAALSRDGRWQWRCLSRCGSAAPDGSGRCRSCRELPTWS
jgi:hypothetical protein